MRKIKAKELIEFRRKTDRSKKNFVRNLVEAKIDDKSQEGGGGDYWIRALSAISNAFKYDNDKLLKFKVDEIQSNMEDVELRTTLKMYQRNIDALLGFEGFDFSILKPIADLTFHKRQAKDLIIDIKGVSIQVRPQHVFSYTKDDDTFVGCVWFVAKLDGLKTSELGIFSELIYVYLKERFSEECVVIPMYCIAVDVINVQIASYEDLLNGHVPSLLDKTIDELKSIAI